LLVVSEVGAPVPVHHVTTIGVARVGIRSLGRKHESKWFG